jgi:hypothetical protein
VRALVALLATSPTLAAHAQEPPPEPPPDVRAEIDAGGTEIQIESRWGKRAGVRLRVGKAKPVLLARGGAAAALVSGHGRVIAAIVRDHQRAPFVVFDAADTGKPRASIARPGKRRGIPFAVVAAATADGFAVFFQEVQQDDPTAAHTYLALLDKTGEARGAAREVAVPWALADAIDNGDGYHLALFYPGGSDGMRLSMVSLSRAGQPQQHPDWASAAGFIADVHLVRRGEAIVALYRGGGGGDRLLESDVTAIRQWGQEPPKARDHGALPFGRVIAVKGGKPIKVRRR